MPLTPEDVHKKTFTPVRLREGYDMGEVDQFLDEVEMELTRLLKEGDDLRAQLAVATANGSRPLAAKASPPQPAPVPVQAPPPQAAPVQAGLTALPKVSTVPEASAAAVRLLEIATNNADQLVNEAQTDADRIVGEARVKAERLDKESRTKAERLESDARTRAKRLDAETNEQREQVLGDLQREKKALARELEELRQFEREYRSRLKSYFESQLRALDGEGDGHDAELTADVDADSSDRLRGLLEDSKA